MKLSVVILTLLFAGVAVAYEEPDYEVVEERDGYEVRRYAGYVVAETVVEADFKGAGNEAFRRLFGYISGNNRRAESMAVTAPVGATRRNEKIHMTIPVVTTVPAEAGNGSASYTYYFVMPATYTLDSLPTPDDPRIAIREVPARTVAVRRYSGRSNESNYLENRELLFEALQRDGMTLLGEPLFAVYNGPFTPWFMRRNEVMVGVKK